VEFKAALLRFNYSDEEIEKIFRKVVSRRLCVHCIQDVETGNLIVTLILIILVFRMSIKRIVSIILASFFLFLRNVSAWATRSNNQNQSFITWFAEFLAATLEAQGQIEENRLLECFDQMDSDDSGKSED
jgi:hypothetical protein